GPDRAGGVAGRPRPDRPRARHRGDRRPAGPQRAGGADRPDRARRAGRRRHRPAAAHPRLHRVGRVRGRRRRAHGGHGGRPGARALRRPGAAPASPAPGAGDHRLSAIPPAARGLQGRRAGLVSRLLANTVDFCIVALVVAAGYAGAAALRFLWNSRTFTFPAPGFGVLVIVGGVVMVLYLAACWTATGRTYGD